MRQYKHPLFAKRHYEFFAEKIKESDTLEELIHNITLGFCEDNHRFDIDRFQRALSKSDIK